MSQLKKSTSSTQPPQKPPLVRTSSYTESHKYLSSPYFTPPSNLPQSKPTQQHHNIPINLNHYQPTQIKDLQHSQITRRYSQQQEIKPTNVETLEANSGSGKITKIPAVVSVSTHAEIIKKMARPVVGKDVNKIKDEQAKTNKIIGQKSNENIAIETPKEGSFTLKQTPKQVIVVPQQIQTQTPGIPNVQKSTQYFNSQNTPTPIPTPEPNQQQRPEVDLTQQKQLVANQPNNNLQASFQSYVHKQSQYSPSKYAQMSDPETHIYNISKFEEMMSDLMQQPALKINSKRMVQKELESFWDQQLSLSLVEAYTPEQPNGNNKSNISINTNPSNTPCLGDFAKGKKLGKGMFGQVFLVVHKLTGFVCALKVVSKEVLRVQAVQPQFVQELKLHSYLQHANIVQIYGHFHDAANVYVLQELCTDGQLFDLLIRRRRISEKRAAYYIKQLVQGLRFVHTMDVTHRDVKPENILLSSGVVKICDFGWAAHSADNQHKGRCGTPLYLSPEVVQDLPYCEKVDVWGVGLITYELLVGNVPWNIWVEEETAKIVTEELTFPEYVKISDTAKKFIEKALAKDPEQRITLLETFTDPFLIGVNCMEHQDETFEGYGEATP